MSTTTKTTLIKDIAPNQWNLEIEAKVVSLVCHAESKVGNLTLSCSRMIISPSCLSFFNLKDDQTLRVAEFLVSDNTGQVFLQVFDDEMEAITVGSTFRFKNIKTIIHRGFLHITSRPFSINPLSASSHAPTTSTTTTTTTNLVHASNIQYEYVY